MPIIRSNNPFGPTQSVEATDVHIVPDQSHELQMDEMIRLEAEAEATRHGFARVIHEGLVERIRAFEATLTPNEEIGAYLASFGSQILIHIESVGYSHPFLIIFTGVDTQERRVQLVQHTTRLNVLLVALSVEPPREPRRMGFHTDNDATGNT